MNLRPFLNFIIIYIIIFSCNCFAQQNASDNRENEVLIPQNDLGEIINEFIYAINSIDSNSIGVFTNTYLNYNLKNIGTETWSREKYFKLLNNLRKDGGIINPVDIKQNALGNQITVIFSTSKTNKIAGIEFTKNTNQTLKSLEIYAMDMPKAPYKWTDEKLNESGIASAIDEKVSKDFNSGIFSGNVLIAKDDIILLEKSYGFSNQEKQIPNNSLTRFHTGSVGKMITATAIAQLVESGKLKFTDTLGTILENYPNKQAAESVTINELLTHTSGIADPFELGRRNDGIDYSTPLSNIPLFADAELKMEPGSYHSYSNGNYAVLAAIVEKVSKMNYEDYLKENIFQPAGMDISNIEYYEKLPMAIRYSHSMAEDPLAIKNIEPVNDIKNDIQFEYSGYSNGYLTTKDIYKFLLALRTGQLVSTEMVEYITSGKVVIEEGIPVKYAYGFYDVNMWGVNMRGHSGGGSNSGIGAEAEMLWNSNYYIVVLGNCDLDKVRPITFSIARFLGTQK